MADPNNNENPGNEEFSKESLIALLKDKSRELKIVSTKLYKVEEKYKTIFKESQANNKEKDVLLSALKEFLGETYDSFFKQDSKFNIEAFKSHLVYQSQEKEEFFKKQEEELQKKVKSKAEDLEAKYTKHIKSLRQQISDSEQANTKLAKEILEISALLKSEQQALNSFKKTEQEISAMKGEMLLAELQLKSKLESLDESEKMKEANRANELVRLRNENESMATELHSLREAMKSASVSRISTSSQTKAPKFSSEFIQTDSDLTNVHNNGLVAVEKENPKVNNEYLKHAIIKYFTYSDLGNYDEAGIIRHVIATILKFTPEEMKKLEESKNASTLWKTAKSYIWDSSA